MLHTEMALNPSTAAGNVHDAAGEPNVANGLRQWLLNSAGIHERRMDALLAILDEEDVETVQDLRVLASRVGGVFDARLTELAATKIRMTILA